MLTIILSPLFFLTALALFGAGAIGSLFLQKNDKVTNWWSNSFAVLGTALGLCFSSAAIYAGKEYDFMIGSSPFSLLSFSFHVDLLSSFFIFAISLIGVFCSVYAFGYVTHYYGKYQLGTLGFFYNILFLSLFLVVSSANALFFLIAWELMSIASYFLVVYDRNDPANIKAGSLYLVMTYVGTAFIILAFLFLYKYTGSFDFSAIASGIALVPQSVKNAIFIFALIGFGIKAGIIPLHIWLPAAHPAAPSHVSALMSGVMIKTGIYMMMRLFLDILQPVPLWWGETVLVIGAVSSLLGVLYALTEHDIKRLLAYHSIENIGIILLGLGSALIFYTLGVPSLALLSFIAALFHTINHAIFKSLLFLSAGSVINEVHTKNMEEYGGLIKYMPSTALFFLIGSMAISALPPLNGFFSEWLTYQSLFQGITSFHYSLRWIFVLAASSLVFTGGLALMCFAKAFGAIFLARPRSGEVLHAKESAMPMRVAMGLLSIVTIFFGIFSGYVTRFLEQIAASLDIFHTTTSFVSVTPKLGLLLTDGFARVSAPVILGFFAVVFGIVVISVRFLVNRKQKIVVGKTWDCGTTLGPRMEITSTGFARSIILVFKSVLKPSLQREVRYHDEQSRYFSHSGKVSMHVIDMYQQYFYEPINTMINGLSLRVKNIQGGNINVYISYIFIALIISLYVVL
ncbi:MAG: hypothetical protein A2845_04205 [Candidatus Lloydbacteria bacterium RIFCSPHIGHO2_01_FULL_49_22]|uniref:NADH:quinone oxidoreductase/Mrp antiporter transmembrane domain-containing protein n=1 Tax=Candidatus Lloydbacteria bacterium RIFCSPHIGHO2_01_FULL_49_22 TaxID=1798658 RepID=A0A1G2CU64_9BACT|nr:MAG: hypothetical protein A2845_04205 [Candidatus Lloydbacteria bacterium RIFCSPHIGHO2_01_FULL_49_22]OGZ08859.1 MAG: hypothetical protein A3C14_01240 [Candidatus Lloydbacteria bacterium RIFCSPHIGHO2_02_FULL_50_18]